MSLFKKARVPANSPKPAPQQFVVDVVGESHHQAELEQLCGGKCHDGHDLATAAVLVANPDNPYDANAVEVRIGAHLVGHLARDVAANVSPILQAKPEAQSDEVPARITGGWDRGNGDVGHFGVSLRLPRPEAL